MPGFVFCMCAAAACSVPFPILITIYVKSLCLIITLISEHIKSKWPRPPPSSALGTSPDWDKMLNTAALSSCDGVVTAAFKD